MPIYWAVEEMFCGSSTWGEVEFIFRLIDVWLWVVSAEEVVLIPSWTNGGNSTAPALDISTLDLDD